MTLFTIITVCYNAQAEIRETLLSVLNQKYKNYEYIIVDGASKDKTVKIAQEYSSAFQNSGGIYKIFSEPDTGIYNAMNKGVKRASGKYIIFMNAGDKFFDGNVLTAVQKEIEDENYPDILYGRTVFNKYGLYQEMLNGNFQKIPDGMQFAHMSSFCKRELLLQNPFDEHYRIAADYDFFSKMFDMNKTSIKSNEFISIFDNTGVSSTNEIDTKRETLEVRLRHGYITESEYQCILSITQAKANEQKSNTSIINMIKNVLIPYRIRKMHGIKTESNRLKAQGWTSDLGRFR